MADIPISPPQGNLTLSTVKPTGPFTSIQSPRSFAFKTVPTNWPADDAEHRRRVAEVLNRAMLGKLNCTGTVTLTASAATTTLNDRRISAQSVILFMPTTANAATEIATMYVSARTQYSATIAHANNAQTDRTFGYVVIG